jgi:Glycosyl hydrolases family 39
MHERSLRNWAVSCCPFVAVAGESSATRCSTAPRIMRALTIAVLLAGAVQCIAGMTATKGTLGIYPSSANVFAGSQQVFQAQLSTIPDANQVTYSVDGIVDGNDTTGTITNQGVYTAPKVAGSHTITVKDDALGTTAKASVDVYSSVSVNFALRSTEATHYVPAHLFGAERMDSMHNAADLDLVKAGGISYARFYALIPIVFKTTTPNWSSIDAVVQRISAGGVKVMLQMYQTPPWLQPNPNPCGTGNPSAMPANLNEWAQIAVQYVKHMDDTFPGVVTDYEIWNEPNTDALCVPPTSRESDYLDIYRTAAPLMRAQIKADHSSARVGGPATAGLQATWATAMLNDSTISQNIDFYSYHDYIFSNTQAGAEWNTYTTVPSILQLTQNSSLGPEQNYLEAAQLVAAGKQPQGKNLPIYNSEFNLNGYYVQTCCQNNPTYAPVWNGLSVAGMLNAVYAGASNTVSHMVYFAANAHPYYCLVGEINASMDCLYPLGSTPKPYPSYFVYQLFGATKYLGLQSGGHMASTLSPLDSGGGLVVTAFFTSSLDSIVLINPTPETLTNVTVEVVNSGLSGASATLYSIVNGDSIQSSSISLKSTGGSSYSTQVTLPPNSVKAIAIR